MTKNKVVEDIEEIKELPDLSQEDEKCEHNSIDSYQTKNNTSPLVYNKGHLTGRFDIIDHLSSIGADSQDVKKLSVESSNSKVLECIMPSKSCVKQIQQRSSTRKLLMENCFGQEESCKAYDLSQSIKETKDHKNKTKLSMIRENIDLRNSSSNTALSHNILNLNDRVFLDTNKYLIKIIV